MNGTVYADFVTLDNSSTIKLGTVNGSVKLFIPSDSSATVKASTRLAAVFATTSNCRFARANTSAVIYTARIGGGSVKITLSSVNGGLFINRKKDGKTLKPFNEFASR